MASGRRSNKAPSFQDTWDQYDVDKFVMSDTHESDTVTNKFAQGVKSSIQALTDAWSESNVAQALVDNMVPSETSRRVMRYGLSARSVEESPNPHILPMMTIPPW